MSREQAESARLKTKYKREMKGAMREIRRDKAYVASVKIRQKILRYVTICFAFECNILF